MAHESLQRLYSTFPDIYQVYVCYPDEEPWVFTGTPEWNSTLNYKLVNPVTGYEHISYAEDKMTFSINEWDEFNLKVAESNVGVKYDTGKVRMDLIPPEVMTALATILTKGAEKYAKRNWEKGMEWGKVFGALMRHMWAWWARKDNDPEWGLSHLWHAVACLAFLITYEQRKIGIDDRAKVDGEKT